MTLHTYLSPEWLAAAEPIRERFLRSDSPAADIAVNVTVTDVPFGSGRLEMHAADGVPNIIHPGHVDGTSFQIRIDWGLARLSLLDTTGLLLEMSIKSGEIDVTGDVEALRRYWKSHIGDQAYLDLLEALRDITK